MLKRMTVLCAAFALALSVAACGASDDPDNVSGAVDLGEVTPVDGCGAESHTDPADNSQDRPVARCDAGAPAPQPLKTMTKVTVTTVSMGAHLAPFFVGKAMDEFKKENLDIELVQISGADALPQLASGNLDLAYSGTDAGFFNAVDQGLGITMVAGNFTSPDAGNTAVPQNGVWARRDAFSDPANPDLSELKGKVLGSSVGVSSALTYPMDKVLQESEISLSDVEIKKYPSADMFTALKNGAVDAAWLLDPYWLQAAEHPEDYVLIGTGAKGEPLGGLYSGKSMKEHPEVLQAVMRAFIRVINTYLDGDYYKNDAVMDAVIEGTKQDKATLTRTPALLFDWEVRENTGLALQKLFIEFGTVKYDKVIPDKDYVDRSAYERAVGWTGE